jgi:hypothetical protein
MANERSIVCVRIARSNGDARDRPAGLDEPIHGTSDQKDAEVKGAEDTSVVNSDGRLIGPDLRIIHPLGFTLLSDSGLPRPSIPLTVGARNARRGLRLPCAVFHVLLARQDRAARLRDSRV